MHSQDREPHELHPSSYPSQKQHLNSNPHHSSVESDQLQAEIALLNSRLDKIDQHCKQFTKLAQEKSLMEQNLKNLCYLQVIDTHKGEAEKETRVRPYAEQRDCNHNNRSDGDARSVSPAEIKQASLDTYERDMATFNRIMD